MGNEMRCNLFTASINQFVQPVFTLNFEKGVKSLYEAATANDANLSYRRNKAIKFIEEFGTHYTQKTFFGATLSLESRWASSAKSDSERSERQKCVANAYSKSVTKKAGIPEVFDASSSNTFKNESNSCKGSSDNSEFFSSRKMRETKIVARGASFSTDPAIWAESVDKNYVPIDYNLMSISSIFKKGWMNYLKDEDGENIDGTILSEFLDSMTQNYCENILGHTCIPHKGCGINGVCQDGKVCIANENSDNGYDCVDEGSIILYSQMDVTLSNIVVSYNSTYLYNQPPPNDTTPTADDEPDYIPIYRNRFVVFYDDIHIEKGQSRQFFGIQIDAKLVALNNDCKFDLIIQKSGVYEISECKIAPANFSNITPPTDFGITLFNQLYDPIPKNSISMTVVSSNQLPMEEDILCSPNLEINTLSMETT